MAGQGKSIRRIASILKASRWDVVFVCVPNSPHTGVVPLPTVNGITAQRYPDVLSVRGDVLRLSEVEVSLSPAVQQHAIERFHEQRNAIAARTNYLSWRARILELTGYHLPEVPVVLCELVICAGIPPGQGTLREALESEQIAVVSVQDYVA